MRPSKLPPIHPGQVLKQEFLEPLGISQYRLAKDIGVPSRRINEIVRGQRAISASVPSRPTLHCAFHAISACQNPSG